MGDYYAGLGWWFLKKTFKITKNLISGISFMMIVLYYHIKMLIDFWCKIVLWDLKKCKIEEATSSLRLAYGLQLC